MLNIYSRRRLLMEDPPALGLDEGLKTPHLNEVLYRAAHLDPLIMGSCKHAN